MSNVASRPEMTGRPHWVSISDWLAIQERAAELRYQREETGRRQLRHAAASARIDLAELDLVWSQDPPVFEPITAYIPRTRRRPQGTRRGATCNRCNHQWLTEAIRPTCSGCKSKSIHLDPLNHDQDLAAAS